MPAARRSASSRSALRPLLQANGARGLAPAPDRPYPLGADRRPTGAKPGHRRGSIPIVLASVRLHARHANGTCETAMFSQATRETRPRTGRGTKRARGFRRSRRPEGAFGPLARDSLYENRAPAVAARTEEDRAIRDGRRKEGKVPRVQHPRVTNARKPRSASVVTDDRRSPRPWTRRHQPVH